MSSVAPINVLKFSTQGTSEVPDILAVEEPLEIRLGYGLQEDRKQKSLSVTMRTPGNDLELAAGFLITENIITSFDQLLSIKHCNDLKAEERENVVRAELHPDVELDWELLNRHFYTSSSCGVCGKTSIESVTKTNCLAPFLDDIKVSYETILGLPQKLDESQLVFKHTGGIHASAIFDLKGEIETVREDVGRHNALDKIIGAYAIKKEFPFNEKILLLSGRISFELVQKAAIARIPIVVAFGAPSSLAVHMANELSITLIGFLKEKKFNVYTGRNRVISA